MSLKKFQKNDVFRSIVKTHPSFDFFIYSGSVYLDKERSYSGSFSENVLNVSGGYVSLYEMNIDRADGTNPFIYPFITKDGTRTNFRSISSGTFDLSDYGTVLTASYPLSASISRNFYQASSSGTTQVALTSSLRRRVRAMSTLFKRGERLSPKYTKSASFGDKFSMPLNLISIPSILYGSEIKRGSMDLKWYLSGTLVGQLQDIGRNGELVQVGPTGSTGSGSVAGVVFYNQGFVVLTGSWALNSSVTLELIEGGGTANPSWLYFGAGGNDIVANGSSISVDTSASFDMSYKGTNRINTVTMFAHAERDEMNFSTNPTFLEYSASNPDLKLKNTSSVSYVEADNISMTNLVSSSFTDQTASFKKTTYITRIGIYDENKNLIGVANLANPIKKTEDRNLTFKITLDI